MFFGLRVVGLWVLGLAASEKELRAGIELDMLRAEVQGALDRDVAALPR